MTGLTETLRWTCGVGVCLAALLAVPTGAHAAFPGSNGDIVFTGVQQSPFGLFVPFPATVGGAGIYVASPDGTGPRPLKVAPTSSAAPENEGFAGPKWSPDGSKIAYSHWSGSAVRIAVMNADGSGSEPIGPAGAWGPAWLPDGSMIAFTRPDQGVGIYVMDADGGNPRLLVAERTPWAESVTWSPDCSRIAFSADGGLWTMRPNGRVHVVSRGFDPDGGFDPDWSPDGSKIAYWNWAGGQDEWFGAKLFVVNADGSRERRVRAGAGPAWSPDGSRIVFARWGGLATISADGSDLRTVTVADNTVQWHVEPDWQPLTEAAPSAGRCDTWRTDISALPQLRVSVRPRTVRPQESTLFRFKVTRGADRPVRRAVIYFAGKRTRTNARGRAMITHEFPYRTARRVVATKGGFIHDTAMVRTPPES